ncbi:MAG TPA: hypothetical protein PLP93_07470 [Nitrosomonas sp.]|nr:hypothetical protein [Nitrosomonas sp.]HRB45653.1 hypothetical protein [Nitrosomonas sp.]HRB77658.1 hypothetical protein [Nitrosomonas sp.]
MKLLGKPVATSGWNVICGKSIIPYQKRELCSDYSGTIDGRR